MTQATITKLLDGPRNAVYHVSILADGSGDLGDEILIDPATSFNPALPAVPGLRIAQLWYDLSGFNAILEFDYLVSDTPIWSMSGGQANHVDFSCFGGLADRSNELDGSGKLKLSTSGLDTGDFGTLIVYATKS